MINSSIIKPSLLFGDMINPLIPAMTSDTTPSGIALASVEGSTPAYWGMLNNLSHTYISNVTVWIQYKLPTNRVIKKYSVYCGGSSDTYQRGWTLAGSSDGISFDILDTRSAYSPTLNISNMFTMPNNNKQYKYYRMNITDANFGGGSAGAGAVVGVAMWQLYGY